LKKFSKMISDANKRSDKDYRTNENKYTFGESRVKYIGNSTLWIRELFL